MILLEIGEIDKILTSHINLKIDHALDAQEQIKANFEETYINEHNELMYKKYNYKEVIFLF